jgi:hypothetical protein
MNIGHGGRGHLIIKSKAPIGYNLGGVNRKIYVLTVDNVRAGLPIRQNGRLPRAPRFWGPRALRTYT